MMKKFFLQNQFIKHNKKYFKFQKKFKNQILVEFNSWAPLHISNSYLLKTLQQKYKSNIVAYAGYTLISSPISRNIINKFKWFFGSFLPFKNFGIYKSMGCIKFIWPEFDNKNEVERLYNRCLKRIKTKRDFENLKINNIWVGDIIYDSYLKYFHRPTIDLKDMSFKKYLKNSIELFLFWENYFKKNKVKAIIYSHAVYLLALPARIAIQKGIKAYVCHSEYLYSLNKKNLFARAEFLDANKDLKKINDKILDLGIKNAKKRIKLRLSGKKAIDIWWAKKSSFGKINKKRVLNQNNKFKFLIANHSFLDSPHVYGKHLFPDFYEWLNFLGEISDKSDCEWYIKTHPYEANFEKGYTIKIINSLLKKYPKIKLIPSKTSHNQIVKEGINCVLTVLGSVGLEYAAMNIPVINASKKNPHIDFDFNIHPSSVKQYTQLLMNPKKIKIKIDKLQIYKYYFYMNVFFTRNWLFKDYPKMERKLKSQYNPEVYKYWIDNEFSVSGHEKILANLNNFIDSNDYRIGYKFIDRSIIDDIINYEKEMKI